MKIIFKLASLSFVFTQVLNASNLSPQTREPMITLPGFQELVKPLESNQSCSSRLILNLAQFAEKHFLDGKYLFENNRFAEAISSFKEALDIPNVEKTFLAKIYHCLGNVYVKIANPDEAISHYQKALTFPEWTGASRASTLHNLGLVYGHKELYDDSVVFFKKSLEIPERENEKQACTHHYLGIAYSRLKDSAKAIFHYKQALKIPDWQGSPQSETLIQLSKEYASLGDHGRAISRLRKVLQIPALVKITYALTHYLLGNSYLYKEDYNSASLAYHTSLEFKELTGKNRARIFHNLGLLAEHQKLPPLKVLEYYFQAMRIPEWQDADLMQTQYNVLAFTRGENEQLPLFSTSNVKDQLKMRLLKLRRRRPL